jgi:hypothetical protein
MDGLDLSSGGCEDHVREVVRFALGDDEVVDTAAAVLQPFAGRLIEAVRSTQALVETRFDFEAMSEAAAVFDAVGELIGHLNAELAGMFEPDPAAQAILDEMARTWMDALHQITDAPAGSGETRNNPLDDLGRLMRESLSEFSRERPVNWPDPAWPQILELVVTTGLPIVGVVPATVVEAVLAGVEDGLDPVTVLVAARAENLAAVRTVAARPDVVAGHHDAAAELDETVTLVEQGMYSHAIRASFAVIDSILYRRRYQDYAAYRDGRVASIYDVTIDAMRDLLARHCLADCYTRYEIGRDPTPSTLNRHLVMHSVDRSTATETNAIIAILYAATLLAAQHPQPHPSDMLISSPGDHP